MVCGRAALALLGSKLNFFVKNAKAQVSLRLVHFGKTYACFICTLKYEKQCFEKPGPDPTLYLFMILSTY